MTERRYYYSDDLQGQAQVLSCTPAEAGAYAVELDATLFHPQGGGQPSDVGTLGGVAVLRVQQQAGQMPHRLHLQRSGRAARSAQPFHPPGQRFRSERRRLEPELRQ